MSRACSGLVPGATGRGWVRSRTPSTACGDVVLRKSTISPLASVAQIKLHSLRSTASMASLICASASSRCCWSRAKPPKWLRLRQILDLWRGTSHAQPGQPIETTSSAAPRSAAANHGSRHAATIKLTHYQLMDRLRSTTSCRALPYPRKPTFITRRCMSEKCHLRTHQFYSITSSARVSSRGWNCQYRVKLHRE